MICVRDDDIFFNAIWRQKVFINYHMVVDIGIITSRPFPAKWIKKNLRMYEVCNHSHSNDAHSIINWPAKKQIEDFDKSNNIIYKKIGFKPKYFIPTHGFLNERLIESCESIGLALHPSYAAMRTKKENYYTAHKVDIIGKKKDGMYAITLTANQPKVD